LSGAPDIALRAASAGNIPALTRVWHDAWHQGHAHLDPDIAARRPFRFFVERIASPPVDTVVACVDGEVVGFAYWQDDRVQQVFVLPAWHGRGVAPLLLAAAEEALKGRGHNHIRLQCRKGNGRARAFYEKHGWSIVGEMDSSLGHVEGRAPVIVWQMEKTLPSV